MNRTLKEKLKINNKSVIIGLVFFLISVFFLFFYDIGLNSKYFIERDFSRAFLFRQTGNCEEFVKYLNQDWANWIERCYAEKKFSRESIESFKINGITINGNRSFIQASIKRDTHSYPIDYEMIRLNGRWFIDQNISNI